MMNTSTEKSSGSKSLFSAPVIVIGGMTWAILALLFFLLYSVPLSEDRGLPAWYSVGTYIFENASFLAAALLCFRNWRSPQIVSGRNVWLGIGLGTLFYFLGNFLFGLWEYWGLDPDVSLGDAFFIGTYLCLSWGMILAVISRKLNLEIWQWGVLAAIALVGGALAWVLSVPADEIPLLNELPAIEQSVPAPTTTPTATNAPGIKPAANSAQTPVSAATPETTSVEDQPTAPAWAMAIDETLKPFANYVSLFYVIADLFLVVVASALLLAFWGGRFSQSWRMIAAAAFSLYIADMWFKYAEKNISDYQSGGLLEVFWVFSGVLFAIGAVLEYDLSSRSRRTGGRRRAS